ncbi:MAG: DNA (cytosine-5-)-methyltransferase, partial [Muribaculaceae bacterium]|nr:DNA (cytosine-5-)-methyltransferase [Muribaculaceae bacterium]
MLFFEMVKILKEKKPRAFIAENVKGILSANNKKAFPMILKEFSAAGYKVQYYIVNASKFGVPQKRERVIIIGFRDERDKKNFSLSLYIPNSTVLRDVIDANENDNETLFFSDRAVAGMMAVREKMNKGRAQNLSQPCNTISAHLAKVSLNSTDPVLMVGERYRRFSCREAARIQSFPEGFKIDMVSAVRQYKAIGNAVPPVMMWYIANCIQKAFELSDRVTDKAPTPYVLDETECMHGFAFEPPALYGK